MPKPVFTSWDGRPAIVMSDASVAVAIIEPGGDWEEVDAMDPNIAIFLVEKRLHRPLKGIPAPWKKR